jgi:HEAT repeat protein
MLRPEDIKAQKHFLLGALVVGLLILGINYMTGYFTQMHLRNEEVMAIEHGADSPLYKQMVNELISDLQSEITWKRRLAAVELGHLGSGAHRAIPQLQRLLDDETAEVRKAAALALARIGNFSGDMVAPLIELFQEPNDHYKYLAAKALGQIGPAAKEAIPVLEMALQAGQQDVNKAVIEALEKISRGFKTSAD